MFVECLIYAYIFRRIERLNIQQKSSLKKPNSKKRKHLQVRWQDQADDEDECDTAEFRAIIESVCSPTIIDLNRIDPNDDENNNLIEIIQHEPETETNDDEDDEHSNANDQMINANRIDYNLVFDLEEKLKTWPAKNNDKKTKKCISCDQHITVQPRHWPLPDESDLNGIAYGCNKCAVGTYRGYQKQSRFQKRRKLDGSKLN